MLRASSGDNCSPLKRIMRLIASSHPSGVVRMKEMRVIFPLASGAWQPPHLLKVSAPFTGNPASSGLLAGVVTFTSGVAPAFCAVAGRQQRAVQKNAPRTRPAIDSIPPDRLGPPCTDHWEV